MRKTSQNPLRSVLLLLRTLLLPEGIKQHRQEWNHDNVNALWLICFGGMALSVFGIVLSYLYDDYYEKVPYILFLVIFAGFAVLLAVLREKLEEQPLPAVYLLGSLVFAADIMIETSMSRDAVFMFCLLQIVLAVCYMDYPLRIFVFELVFTALFLAADVYRRSGFPDHVTEDTRMLIQLDVMRVTIGLVCALILYTFTIWRRERLTETALLTREAASRDALTGIYNRGAGQTVISQLASSGVSGTFVLMDVDDFKHINDAYGHGRGDEVLQSVAAVLASSFRATDVIMRMGGDEFMVYAVGMLDARYVEKKMGDVRTAMHEIVLDEKSGDHVSVSAGCLINLGDYKTYESLYAAADRLLYHAKQLGKDRLQISAKTAGKNEDRG